MALIPQRYLDSVVAIGVNINNEKKWIGTGFIVGRKRDQENLYDTFLAAILILKSDGLSL